ncbi:MAG TPA: hypothetical protein VG253_17735 [Streptosporangiaceae bacterium]|nr:hypothetical protein [Streptosporangiaceae bacterium]
MPDYANFFLGSTTVAGALTGLLFVALSVAPERLSGRSASLEHQSIAATAFTALVDSLLISLIALRPGNGIPVANIVFGVLGLTSTTALGVRLWLARGEQRLSHRWPFLLPAIAVIYGFQTVVGFTATTRVDAQSEGATLVLIFFAVGIARSWELLGLRGGGLLDLLASRNARSGPEEVSAGASGEQAPPRAGG